MAASKVIFEARTKSGAKYQINFVWYSTGSYYEFLYSADAFAPGQVCSGTFNHCRQTLILEFGPSEAIVDELNSITLR